MTRGTAPSLMWFRSDLRLDDNPALLAAAEALSPVIPIFIWAPEEEDPWPPGAASRWWLHHSLVRLQQRLVARGSRLIVRHGPTIQVFEELIAETGAATVFWNRRYEPAVTVRDAALEKALRDRGIRVETFTAAILFEPSTIRSKSTGRPFQVFAAFWRACLSAPAGGDPRSAPRKLPIPSVWPESVAIHNLHLEARLPWADGLKAAWNPGEAGARAGLAGFLSNRLNGYRSERDRPDRFGTSRLSPHLHFGEISPRTIWHAVLKKRTDENAEAVDCYLKELGWREFGYHLLVHFPQTPNQPLHPEFAAFPWRFDVPLLSSWQRGKTGYPLVDAAMRELLTTGWMHNRVRMVVASFLTKHLRISWEDGAYWFWDTLVDADLANNTLGWQWTAGCGADAAPYSRIFSPVRQGERFDPHGDYIRRWVPELSQLAVPWIHSPWAAPVSVLDEAGIKLGTTYPLPVVDHKNARSEAVAALAAMREHVRRRLASPGG